MKHLIDSLVNLCQLSTLSALQIYDPEPSLSPQVKLLSMCMNTLWHLAAQSAG